MDSLALHRCFPRAEAGKLRGEIFRYYWPKFDTTGSN